MLYQIQEDQRLLHTLVSFILNHFFGTDDEVSNKPLPPSLTLQNYIESIITKVKYFILVCSCST